MSHFLKTLWESFPQFDPFKILGWISTFHDINQKINNNNNNNNINNIYNKRRRMIIILITIIIILGFGNNSNNLYKYITLPVKFLKILQPSELSMHMVWAKWCLCQKQRIQVKTFLAPEPTILYPFIFKLFCKNTN